MIDNSEALFKEMHKAVLKIEDQSRRETIRRNDFRNVCRTPATRRDVRGQV